jgi:hypothetical protein
MPERHVTQKVDYRKQALQYYHDRLHCWFCGFGLKDILEVAHLDGHRQNNAIGNLAILCPTCHKMLDLDLITSEMVVKMRDRSRLPRWSKRMKDAGKKAAETRRRNQASARKKRHLAAIKAVATRTGMRALDRRGRDTP